MKSWYNVENKSGRTEVTIYDEIGIWGITFSDFIKDFRDIETPIDIRINCPGGSVFDGLAMYDAINLKRNEVEVNTYVDGMAASMASVIMLASDRIFVTENSRVMIHDVQGGASGKSSQVRKAADIMDAEQDKIVNILTTRMKVDESEVRELMNDETWYHGQEIIDAGLADEMIEGKPMTNKFDINKYNFKNLKSETMVKDENKGLIDSIKDLINGFRDEIKENKLEAKYADKFTEIDNKINEIENLEVEGVEELKQSLQDSKDEIANLTTEKDALTNEVQTLKDAADGKPAPVVPAADPSPVVDVVDEGNSAFSGMIKSVQNKMADYEKFYK